MNQSYSFNRFRWKKENVNQNLCQQFISSFGNNLFEYLYLDFMDFLNVQPLFVAISTLILGTFGHSFEQSYERSETQPTVKYWEGTKWISGTTIFANNIAVDRNAMFEFIRNRSWYSRVLLVAQFPLMFVQTVVVGLAILCDTMLNCSTINANFKMIAQLKSECKHQKCWKLI